MLALAPSTDSSVGVVLRPRAPRFRAASPNTSKSHRRLWLWVHAAALDLDSLNQQLVAELESERSDADLLRLENVRLRERIANNQMLDGALAVLLGVILAVVAPRLWPTKKRQDGWS